jgi:hypothetical protein
VRRSLLPLALAVLLAQPLWAGYGLSNVVRIGLKPAAPAPPAELAPADQPGEIPAANPVPAQAASKPVVKPSVQPVSSPAVKPPLRPQAAPAAKPSATRVKPAIKTVPGSKGGVYPYAVHLSSWRDLDQAVQELNRIGGRVPQAFMTKIDLGPRGIWYRVDCGLCVSAEVAEARRQRIMRSGLVDKDSFVGAPMPLAIELGQLTGLDAARARQAELRRQKIYTYLIGQGSGRYRIVSGAYPDAASARALLDDLKALGLEARLTRR